MNAPNTLAKFRKQNFIKNIENCGDIIIEEWPLNRNPNNTEITAIF